MITSNVNNNQLMNDVKSGFSSFHLSTCITCLSGI